jgi:hypothetical protein
MPETIPRVESKRRSKDNFASVLGGIGKTTDKLDNVCTIEGARCKKVGERESVEDWWLVGGMEGC